MIGAIRRREGGQMTANIGKGRILRVCELCGGVDDHPRQILAGTDAAKIAPRPSEEIIGRVLENAPTSDRARLMADLMDETSATPHYDCCAASGCTHDVCHQVVAAAGGKTGKALHAMLTGTADPIEYRDDLVKGE
jgi:hypothetical protein